MTALQEQAVGSIKRLPDETQAQRAYQNLQKYRKSSPIERDYKAELNEALEEKYVGY